jgi:hypothetical protein
MAKITLERAETGKLDGLSEADKRAYARFRKAVENMDRGDTLAFEFKLPRSPQFHKRHFVILGSIFDAQDTFTDRVQMRKWLEVGAGHADYVPGADGDLVAIPKSIDYESLDDAEFAEHHRSVIAFLRESHAYGFLWPMMTPAGAEAMVESILSEFER